MRHLTHNGETLTVAEWARRTGIGGSTIRSRIDRLGLSVAEALTRPAAEKFHPTPRTYSPTPRSVPALRRDAGKAVVRWTEAGRRRKRVFGPWGSAEASAAYARWAAEWYASQGNAPIEGERISVARLIIRYIDFAEATYRKNGRETSEVGTIRAALTTLNDLYGATAADEFAPPKLSACVARWIGDGLAVPTINAKIRRVCRCFSWGVGHGLIPASVADALEHVPNVKPGRHGLKARPKVTAPSDADLEAAIPHLHPDPGRQAVLEAVVRLLRVTGMRPGEALELRGEDIDRSESPWVYRPESGGKTLHLDKPRKIYLGPKAQEILAPWILRGEPGQPLFRFRSRAGKMVAIEPGLFRWRLQRACDIAGVPVIRPNQLRHSRATEVQRRYESDAAAAAALGNTPEVARQVYVDGPADAVARRIAKEIG